MKGTTFTAQEELWELHKVDRCPECHCSTGNDTEYKDYSNKRIAVCAQCGYEWYLDTMNTCETCTHYGYIMDGKIEHCDKELDPSNNGGNCQLYKYGLDGELPF